MKINIYIYVNQLLLKPVFPSGEFESLRQEAVGKCESASLHASLSLQAVMVIWRCWFFKYVVLYSLSYPKELGHRKLTDTGPNYLILRAFGIGHCKPLPAFTNSSLRLSSTFSLKLNLHPMLLHGKLLHVRKSA